ncbi:hypothetical protein SO3561_01021 [Streptomyces olivochromogenes]|uniref:Uncharacterized protein n=1 Tax=Streptomyces olivochromogenes TaxID=1963 RepID=A0A250V611_STROL|nr:hypothetical protein SO3561_01021 [Streptomyces olivochromogenes]
MCRSAIPPAHFRPRLAVPYGLLADSVPVWDLAETDGRVAP